MSDASTKTCCKCGEVKARDLFPKSGRCRACVSLRQAEGHKANPNIRREKNRKYYLANREKRSVVNKQWANDNPEIVRATRKKWVTANKEKVAEKSDRYCRELNKVYVVNLLTKQLKIKSSFVTPELIEVKRKHLQILRKIKELTNER